MLEEGSTLTSPVGADCCNILLKQLLPNTSYCQRSSVTVFQSKSAGDMAHWFSQRRNTETYFHRLLIMGCKYRNRGEGGPGGGGPRGGGRMRGWRGAGGGGGGGEGRGTKGEGEAGARRRRGREWGREREEGGRCFLLPCFGRGRLQLTQKQACICVGSITCTCQLLSHYCLVRCVQREHPPFQPYLVGPCNLPLGAHSNLINSIAKLLSFTVIRLFCNTSLQRFYHTVV